MRWRKGQKENALGKVREGLFDEKREAAYDRQKEPDLCAINEKSRAGKIKKEGEKWIYKN